MKCYLEAARDICHKFLQDFSQNIWHRAVHKWCHPFFLDLLLKTIFLRIDKILQCVFKEITHFLWPEERTNSNELKECVKMSCADIHNKFITIHRNVCTEYNLSDFWKSRTIYEIRTKVGKQKFLKI